MIKLANTDNTPKPNITATCSWYKTFDVNPSDIECILAYCDNATDFPFNAINNFVSVYKEGSQNPYDTNIGSVIPLNSKINYYCKPNYRLQNDTNLKEEAENFIGVTCSNGTLEYPSIWPTCVETIQCPDPGSTEELVRTEKKLTNHTYLAELEYSCLDQRSYIKTDGSDIPLAPSIVTTCRWRKIYNVDVNNLICEIHHCGHPHSGNGSHPAPPPKYNISLVETNFTQAKHVPFGDTVMYKCDGNTFIENEEIDPTKTNITVQCLTTTGVYKLPETWPNCTETISCGPPPPPPEGGTIIYMNGTENEVRTDSPF